MPIDSRMTHISGFDRCQLSLLPEAIDDYVGSDNPVRFIDAFVGRLDLAAVGFERVTPKATGRPGYAPAGQLKSTDRRVIIKRGFIRRATMEMNLQKIESVDVDQSLIGRIFDYGTVTIRGVGSSYEPLRLIDAPLKLRSTVTAG